MMANEITITGEVNGFAVNFTLDVSELMMAPESGEINQWWGEMLSTQLYWAVQSTSWLKSNGVEPVKAASGGGWGGRAKKTRITDTGDKWRVDVPAVFNNKQQFDKDATTERQKAIKALPHDIHKEKYTNKSGEEKERWHYDVPKSAFVAQQLIAHYSDLEGIDIVQAWLDANPDETPVIPDNVVPLHKRNKALHVDLITKWEKAFGKKSEDYRHESVKTFTREQTESTQDLSEQQATDFMAIIDVILAAQGFWGKETVTLKNKKEVEAWKYELVLVLREHASTSDVWKLLPDQAIAMKSIIRKMADQEAKGA